MSLSIQSAQNFASPGERRDRNTLDIVNGKKRDDDPNVNIIIREPGHVEYAGKLGLGVSDLKKIRVKELLV